MPSWNIESRSETVNKVNKHGSPSEGWPRVPGFPVTAGRALYSELIDTTLTTLLYLYVCIYLYRHLLSNPRFNLKFELIELWRGTSSLLWEQLTQSRRGSPQQSRVDSARQEPREAWEYLAILNLACRSKIVAQLQCAGRGRASAYTRTALSPTRSHRLVSLCYAAR